MLDNFLAILAPYSCLGCGREGHLACPACLTKLQPATPFATANITQIRAVADYSGLAKQLVWQLKFNGAKAAARQMSALMLPLLPQDKSLVIVPVPTATSRVRQRGYDQAALLARQLARLSRLKTANYLARHGQAHQRGANREQRLVQLQAAFRVRKPGLVAGRQLILVDDVVTTGATLEAAASVLTQAGAGQIWALTFAKA